ncbi:MAG: hypothetical protein EOP54_15665 [Sphingobacteriales bacterium]|nr:MAG: hypothetical protein EOP54_15665 [Sphingobacteriales bacterium]
MNKNLFLAWLVLFTAFSSVSMNAQMTIGGKKEPEAFSILELLNKGGLRLPQMTTAQRNAFAVSGNTKGEGLTIYNIDTKCVEYWNKVRWVSLCEGDSQAAISPQPCIGVAADGTGCDSTFAITDPDCPNGPFTISIAAGSEYAQLTDVDNVNGTFKVAFNANETVNIHTVLVRVVSSCTSLYKEFLFSQNGVDCTSMPYTVPTISPASPSLTLCTGGAVYLSVPANTANLDKLIWTRNGVEVARGVSHITATQKGKYNVSMGAIGCNTNAANERTVTESGTAAPTNITILASNNGVLCGTNAVTLTASGSTGTIAWFHNGVEEKAGTTVSINGDSNVGEWFAAVKDGSCYSKPSNTLTITKSTATGQVTITPADLLVNGQPLSSLTSFCSGGSLDLSVANKINGITYTWYNGNDQITSNPYIVPGTQTTMSLRMIATDNSGVQCPAEAAVIEKSVVSGNTPALPTITGNATICDGTTDLTIVPAVAGTYTYTWYKDGVRMAETTPTITVSTPGVTYSGSVTTASGCTSSLAVKAVSPTVSSIPVLSWVANPATSNYGAKVTLQTGIQFGPANSYTWTADKGATITGSGASVTVNLPASGTDGDIVTIKVTALNNCGKSVEITHAITVNNACPTPVLTAQSDLVQNTTAGKFVNEKVSITSAVSATYQWYTNGSTSTTGGTIIPGATTASYNYTPSVAGTYYLYCVVTNGCSGTPQATSPAFTVNAAVNPETITSGAGTLSGTICFDIAESNDNTSCGNLASRQATKANFSLAAVNTQTYTFTASGTVSKVRFVYVESVSGAIVQSLTPTVDKSQALNISGSLTATLVYKSSLSTIGAVQGAAYGKDASTALSVDIYVVYNDNANGTGNDKKVKLTAQIKDCQCCGAKISPTVWKTFMCHNLGANIALDPFTPNPALIGDYYRTGASTPSGAYSSQGWNGSGVKAANDPCPAGYRVPTTAEWKGVLANNTVTAVGARDLSGYSGLKVNGSLFLPAGGYVSNNVPVNGGVGNTYYVVYWGAEYRSALYAITSTPDVSTYFTDSVATVGTPIRCISVN